MPRSYAYDPSDEGEWHVPKDCELIDGQFVEMPYGGQLARVIGKVLSALAKHCHEQNAGWVFTSRLGYRFFPPEWTMLRKVSVSFIRRGRFPNDRLPRGDARIPPDLAVIVIGPDERAGFVNRKVVDFLAHGTRLVWVVDGQSRMALMFRADGSGRWVKGQGFLEGEDVLPGFRVELADILLPDDRESDPAIEVPAAE